MMIISSHFGQHLNRHRLDCMKTQKISFLVFFLLVLFFIGLCIVPVSAKCQQGYQSCNGRCVACPTGSILGSDCKCHKPCGSSNTYCTSGTCCNGKCVSCPSGTMLGSDCKCHKPCGSSSKYCTGGTCCNGNCVSCPSGTMLGSDCKCHKPCGSSSKYCTGGTCCNGNCVSCPSGTMLGSDCLCHAACGSSGQYCRSGSTCLNGKCVSCKEGYYLGRDGSCHSIQNTAARKTSAASESGELISRTYFWKYKGTSYSWKVSIPKSLYDYYRAQPHDRSKLSSYNEYVISEKDKPYLNALITKLKESGKNKGYSESETIMNVIAFVQAFPYFKDDVSTVYDEYPRYSIETLVDNGGDCEDTAILTAALLREMGYGVVLINPTGHMAVGVKCSSCSGTYYPYNGAKYYYLETTGTGFKIGQIPSHYQNSKVKIIPLA